MANDRDTERLLAGMSVEGERDLVGFVDQLRALGHASPAASAAHLERIAAEARRVAGAGVAQPAARAVSGRARRSGVRLGVAVAALVLGSSGLAAAGVQMPGPAGAALEAVGVQKQAPGSGASDSGGGASDAVRDAVGGTPARERDCEFGQRVASAASGKQRAADPCARGKRGKGRGRGKDKGGKGSPQNFGHQISSAARQLTPGGGRQFGNQTSTRARSQGKGRSRGARGSTQAKPRAGAPGG